MDVFLSSEGQGIEDIDEVDTIVHPDAGIVCDSAKIIPDKCVREYWVLDAQADFFLVFTMGVGGIFDEGKTYKNREDVPGVIFPGIAVNLGELQDLIARRV